MNFNKWLTFLLQPSKIRVTRIFLFWLPRSLLQEMGFLQLQRVGAPLQWWCAGFSLWCPLLWTTGFRACRLSCPVAPAWSLTRDHTRVPCSGRQMTLNHWTTRQDQLAFFSGCVKTFKGCFLLGQPVCCPEIPLLRRRVSVSVCV